MHVQSLLSKLAPGFRVMQFVCASETNLPAYVLVLGQVAAVQAQVFSSKMLAPVAMHLSLAAGIERVGNGLSFGQYAVVPAVHVQVVPSKVPLLCSHAEATVLIRFKVPLQ